MRIRPLSVAARVLGAALLSTGLVACNTDDLTTPRKPAAGAFTVNAATDWVYVSLGDSALVSGVSPSESAAWDIAFFGTNTTLNGGAAGPGGVEAACICQNSAATNAEMLTLTPASEQADFDAVTSVPAGITWSSDALTPAISGWFAGTGASAVADPTKTYLVRLADSSTYAKVRITAIQGASTTSPGRVTIEYAVQASPTAALGAAQTREVTVGANGATLVDLNAGTTPIGTVWDLKFEGFSIKVNGGVSGTGKGAAALVTTSFAETQTAKTADQAYRTDSYAGVFGTNRYYRYNISGDNRITPTFDVYLIRRGSKVYKLQVIGYYSPTGTARTITFRYAQIAG